MCAIAIEHAESAKILTSAGNFTSAAGLVRLQYEAVVRAAWALYAASDGSIEKLARTLNVESDRQASKIPLVAEMLAKLEHKAPPEALRLLNEFRQYHWKPLSSFVHGGLHAIHRHGTGYPVALLTQLVRASNGLLMMAGMLLVILHGGGSQSGKLPEIQKEFADCLPPLLK